MRPKGYTSPMTVTLDSTSEQRIQREIERGHYREAAEVVAHALALLDNQQIERSEAISDNAAASVIDRAFGLWADRKEDGLAYQERMRSEW
jgi:Arc/MetJ-type ribon-helix-helix transcriptional regulator